MNEGRFSLLRYWEINRMKIVPLNEAKAKLSLYGRLCHNEPVVVTVNGRPSFQLVPLQEGEDLIDHLIQHHPGFGKTLEHRLGKRSGSIRVATRRYVEGSSSKPSKPAVAQAQTR